MFLTSALLCLATNIFYEARSESVRGQLAVASVTLNRAQHRPENVCKVVLARKQFSWTNQRIKYVNGVPKITGHYRKAVEDAKAWRQAIILASKALAGRVRDTTAGATFYHTVAINPSWAASLKRTTMIGHHIFYRKPRRVKS